MFDAVKEKAVGLVNTAGRLISTPKKPHALDDPGVWRKAPAYSPPADVDIVAAQKWIDDIMGTTRDNQSIYKLIWNGDRTYWLEFFTQWDNLGKPTAPVERWPMVRYKTVRHPITRRPVQHVFPPRWLILSRLEPEQFADHWRQESYVFSPEIRNYKQIRPDVPPKVFWLFFATIAEHTAYCCMTAEKNNKKCFGKYAPPRAARGLLENQRDADIAGGRRSVYEKIDRTFVQDVEGEVNGYKLELADLQADAEVFTENPMALLGLEQSARAGIDDPKQARQIVKDIYDRRIQEQAKLI